MRLTPLSSIARVGTTRAPGFSLVELLIVVAILGILMALLSGGIMRSIQNAKEQRRKAECQALRNALMNYWHDYNQWPHKEGEEQGHNPPLGEPAKWYPTYESQNWKVFDRLSAKNMTKDANPLGKAYIDEATLSTTTGAGGEGTRVSLAKRRTTGFVPKCTVVDFAVKPYRVSFDLKLNTVTVSVTD